MLRRAFACVVALCPACSFDFDGAGPHGGGATDGGGPAGAGDPNGGDAAAGASEGGAPVSDCSDSGGGCVPLPDGFQGAALLGVGCGDAAKAFDGHDSYSFEPASCGCSCVTTSDECVLPGSAQAFGAPLCAPSNGLSEISVVDDCLALPTLPAAQSISLLGDGDPPSCITDGAGPIKPPIEWITPVVGCGFQSIGCGNDICLPGPDQRYCFYRALDEAPVACPDGLVDTRVLLKSDVGDSRDCQCECGAKDSDGCSNPQWQLYSDDSCGATLGSVQSQCGDAGGDIGSARVAIDSQVSCTQGQGPATGTVVVVPTIQACCSPP